MESGRVGRTNDWAARARERPAQAMHADHEGETAGRLVLIRKRRATILAIGGDDATSKP